MNRIVFTLLLIIWVSGNLVAQFVGDDNVRISILTCSPGKDIYSIYGHNAIRIIDGTTGTDLVYNYGTFDFSTKGFVYKFMRGKLPYSLAVEEYQRFLAEYHYYERSVSEQVLYLDSLEKNKIIKYLANNMLPNNRTYKYDFFMDNCATRLREIIDKNVNNFEWDQTKATGKTFRQIIKEYQSVLPWLDFGIDLIIGAPADKVTNLSEESFIPDYLSKAIQNATYNDPNKTPLQYQKTEVLQFNASSVGNKFLMSPYFLFILLFIIEVNLLFRHLKGSTSSLTDKYDTFWLIMITLCSFVMLIMWFGTDHIPTKYNWNILWASPLIPLWWWLNKKGSTKTITIGYIIFFALVITILNAIPGMQFLPQYFHPITAIISITLLTKGWRITNTNV